MELTQTKQKVVDEAYKAALNEMKQCLPIGMASPGTQAFMMTEMMARGMAAAIEATLKNIYTNEEFERDLTLNS